MEFDTTLVEENFTSCIAPRLGEFADRYYERLFSRYPEVKRLFRSPPATQKEHFAFAVRLIVVSLRDPGSFQSLLMSLGGAHATYGVQRHHLPQVGENLIATLREMSGSGWSAELDRAWSGAYESIIEYFNVDRSASGRGIRPDEVPVENDPFALAEDYLDLARRRRATGRLGFEQAARFGELRDRLERQISPRDGGFPFPQRRRDLRVVASSQVEFESNDVHGVGWLRTVSERGVFIATQTMLEPGCEVRVTLDRPSERNSLEISGAVVWNRAVSNPAGPAGIAVSFDQTDERIVDFVGRFLRSNLVASCPETSDTEKLPARVRGQTSKSER